MGNLVVTLASIPLPLITDKIIAPFIFHPERWGGIPYRPPGYFKLTFFTGCVNIAILIALSMLSSATSAIRECDKVDWWISFKRSGWVVLGYLLGNLFAFTMPIIKSPMISVLMFLPYCGYWVNGLIVAPFILLMGALMNTRVRTDICYPED